MLKILILGDICGKIGRRAVAKFLPELQKEYSPDIIIANADNLAHGKGVTPETLKELKNLGIDFFTGGDHAFNQQGSIHDVYSGDFPVLRPENFSPQAPGKGFFEIVKQECNILIVNLVGRVFMRMDHDCPFEAVERILTESERRRKMHVIIDFHAEATSEKIAMLRYLDGRVSALIGTHTHVQTADQQVTTNGTAYISDIGMTGYSRGVLGLESSGIIDSYLSQIKHAHVMPETGEVVLGGVIIEINHKNGKAQKIVRISKEGVV